MDRKPRVVCQNEAEIKMSSRKKWYLVCYDIRDGKRLRKVAKCLEGYGNRLQYSIFRCRLSEKDIECLRWELGEITEKEDELLFIGLCDQCAKRVRGRVGDSEWDTEIRTFKVV